MVNSIKSFKLIVCCDVNYGIGKNNRLPWNIPEEMAHFRRKTIGAHNNCVIMGRNTFTSIPKKFSPLKDRHNLVLSRDKTFINSQINHDSLSFINSFDDIFKFYDDTNFDEYWIIGGKMIYESILQNYINYISEIHVSMLENDFECDTHLTLETYLNDNFILKQETNENNLYTYKVYINQNMDCL